MNQLAENVHHQAARINAARSHAMTQAESPRSRYTESHDAGVLFALLGAYSGIGGVISGDALVALLRGAAEQPISMVARWVAQREVLSFQWGSPILLPVFQFDMAQLRVRPGVLSIMAELRDAFDDMELAEWFARPNSWLRGGIPARCFETDLPAVLQAARADRFVALGA